MIQTNWMLNYMSLRVGIYLEEDEVKQDPTPSKSTDEIKEDEEADEEEFMNLLEGLGGKKVFEEYDVNLESKNDLHIDYWTLCREETVKELWNHLRQDDPDATFQFEKLLEKLSNKIHMKDQEKVSMEEFIRNQNETREEQVPFLTMQLISYIIIVYIFYPLLLCKLIDETSLRRNGSTDKAGKRAHPSNSEYRLW